MISLMRNIFFVALISIVMLLPVLAFGAIGIEDQAGVDPGQLAPSCEGSDCTFAHLVQLGNNILNFLVFVRNQQA